MPLLAPAHEGPPALDLGTAFRDLRLYRAPWEPGTTEVLPLPRLVTNTRPLPRPPMKLAVRPNHWFGPFPDFLITLGYIALGGGGSDLRQSAWTSEATADIGQPPPPAGTPVRWDPPSVVLHAEPAPAPR